MYAAVVDGSVVMGVPTYNTNSWVDENERRKGWGGLKANERSSMWFFRLVFVTREAGVSSRSDTSIFLAIVFRGSWLGLWEISLCKAGWARKTDEN